MSQGNSKPGFCYRMKAKLRSIKNYAVLRNKYFFRTRAKYTDNFQRNAENHINQSLQGYPRDHDYKIINGKLIPSLTLFERMNIIWPLLEKRMDSFLDVGCCRGYYVFEVARKHRSHLSVGIDVHEPYISAANKVLEYLGFDNVKYYFADLEDVCKNPKEFGGPFDTVINIDTYHYLFWGSEICTTAYHDHKEILARLSQISIKRLIISASLEPDSLPANIKALGLRKGRELKYNTDSFLTAASDYFRFEKVNYLGTNPLFLMYKK